MYLLTQIFLIVTFARIYTSASEATTQPMNIGTVLFTAADTRRDCFSADEVALMTTRMMLEDMLPVEVDLVIKDNQYVLDLIDYFRLMLEVVRSLTTGKTKHIILMALTDTLGGYMRHLVLPLAKFAYYAGEIRYSTVIKLYQLYDELKLYLRTDGQGWRKPRDGLGANTEAEELALQGPNPKTDPCKGLIYSKNKKMKRDVPNPLGGGNVPSNVQIPMPFFDSKTHPSAIAVPFRSFTLRNLESRSSAYILVKLYSAVVRCMAHKFADDQSLQTFNTEYFSFLTKKVMPRLEDEKFYAAFGGVLRVMASLRKSGFLGSGKEIGNYNVMPETDTSDIEDINEEEFDVVPGTEKKSKSNLILLAALITIVVWFILGALFICCKIKASKSKGKCLGIKSAASSRSGSSTKVQLKQKFSDAVSKKQSSDKYSGDHSSVKTSKSSKSKKSSDKDSKSSSRGTKSSGKASKSSSKRSKSSAKESKSSGKESKSGSESGLSYCTKDTCKNLKKSSSKSTKGSKKFTESSDSSKTSRSSAGSEDDGRGSLRSRESESGVDYEDEEAGTTSSTRMSSKGTYYPAYYACHSSLTGNYKPTSSSEDVVKGKKKKQFVFGYDFQTTSTESSPREIEDDRDLDGNVSR